MDSTTPIPGNLIDVPLDTSQMRDGTSGYPADKAAGDNEQSLRAACGASLIEFPNSWWIDPKDWGDWARENDKNKTWGLNYVDRFTHQGGSHECTCHALRTVAEAARNKQRGIIYPDGPTKDHRYADSSKGSVWLSPLSIYAEANPGQWGGAGCRQVLNIACSRGFLPEKTQPHEYGFKHTLQGTAGGTSGVNQSNGPWVSVRNFPNGWQETAKLFKPDECIVTSDWECAVCILLRGYVLEYGRDGHAVPPGIWNAVSNAAGYIDSYKRLLWDSLNTFKRAVRSGTFTIVSMTSPDDWLKPAENL